ncbi:hypothetical protein SprV_0501823100 [Sparganum proliferum]
MVHRHSRDLTVASGGTNHEKLFTAHFLHKKFNSFETFKSHLESFHRLTGSYFTVRRAVKFKRALPGSEAMKYQNCTFACVYRSDKKLNSGRRQFSREEISSLPARKFSFLSVPNTSQSTLVQRDSLSCSVTKDAASQERESAAFVSVTAHPPLVAVPQLPAQSTTDHSLATSPVPPAVRSGSLYSDQKASCSLAAEELPSLVKVVSDDATTHSELRQAVEQASVDQLVRLIGPNFAQNFSLWDFLMLRYSTEEPSSALIAELVEEYLTFVKNVQPFFADCLRPVETLECPARDQPCSLGSPQLRPSSSSNLDDCKRLLGQHYWTAPCGPSDLLRHQHLTVHSSYLAGNQLSMIGPHPGSLSSPSNHYDEWRWMEPCRIMGNIRHAQMLVVSFPDQYPTAAWPTTAYSSSLESLLISRIAFIEGLSTIRHRWTAMWSAADRFRPPRGFCRLGDDLVGA